MDEDSVGEILSQLMDIGSATATKGWDIILKQVQVDFYTSIAWLALSLILSAIMIYSVIKSYKWAKTQDSYDGMEYWLPMMLALFAILPTINIIMQVGDIIQIAVNPEWYAIKLLLNQVGG